MQTTEFLIEIARCCETTQTGAAQTGVQNCLRAFGQFAQADHVALLVLSGDDAAGTVEWGAQWSAQENSIRDLSGAEKETAAACQWAVRQLAAGQGLFLSELSSIPPHATAEREIWQSADISSVLALPLLVEEYLLGALVLHRCSGDAA